MTLVHWLVDTLIIILLSLSLNIYTDLSINAQLTARAQQRIYDVDIR